MVNAWAVKNRLVLGPFHGEGGLDEITLIPELLRVLALKGCIVTVDAIGGHKSVAEQVIDRQGDYVLAVKANQPKLLHHLRQVFDRQEPPLHQDLSVDTFETYDENHGRIETRRYWTTDQVDDFADGTAWKGLGLFGMVEAQRQVGDQVSVERRYYISSLDNDAQRFGEAVRRHWSIENSLHWVLDVVFREDDSRVRTGHASENRALLRQMAVSLLQQEKTAKVGVQTKRLKAGWDNTYLAKVLSAGHF